MALMTMSEFVDTYCTDIQAMKDSMLNDPFANFHRDDVVDGVAVIYDDDGREILVEDIVELPFQDFIKKYRFDSAAKAFYNYISAYTITSGEDLFFEVNREIAQKRAEIDALRGVSTYDLFKL